MTLSPSTSICWVPTIYLQVRERGGLVGSAPQAVSLRLRASPCCWGVPPSPPGPWQRELWKVGYLDFKTNWLQLMGPGAGEGEVGAVQIASSVENYKSGFVVSLAWHRLSV